MPIAALNSLYVIVAASTTGGTAPGGATAPTGCTLSTPSDISAYITGIEVGPDVATVDSTTFGSGGFTTMVAGLRSATSTIQIINAYGAGEPNALLGVNGSVVAVNSFGFLEVRPTSGARSSTNPGFICRFLNNGWRSFNATVGGLPTVAWSITVVGGYGELTA